MKDWLPQLVERFEPRVLDKADAAFGPVNRAGSITPADLLVAEGTVRLIRTGDELRLQRVEVEGAKTLALLLAIVASFAVMFSVAWLFALGELSNFEVATIWLVSLALLGALWWLMKWIYRQSRLGPDAHQTLAVFDTQQRVLRAVDGTSLAGFDEIEVRKLVKHGTSSSRLVVDWRGRTSELNRQFYDPGVFRLGRALDDYGIRSSIDQVRKFPPRNQLRHS